MTIPATGHSPDFSESRFIEVNGFTLHYRQAGSGEPLVLLLHGSFLSMRSWRLVFNELAKTTTVIAFDRPAFGNTSRPLSSKSTGVSYTPEAQSDLVITMMKQLGFHKAVLAGNSTGGTLALLTALRYPEYVVGVVLVDAMIYSGYATSEVPALVKPVMRAMTPLFSGLMKILIFRLYEKVIGAMWYNRARLSNEVLGAFKGDQMQGDWARAFWELFLETHHLRLGEQLKTMMKPALVITGEYDAMVKKEESIKLAGELPLAELVVVPDCGHLPHEEQPEAFLLAVTNFLKRIIPG